MVYILQILGVLAHLAYNRFFGDITYILSYIYIYDLEKYCFS